MAWIALRRTTLLGTAYERGDVVPDDTPNRRALAAAGVLVETPEPRGGGAEALPPPNLRAMRRGELEAYAAGAGIADPAAYATKDDLIAVLTGEAAPMSGPDDAEPDEADEADEAEPEPDEA